GAVAHHYIQEGLQEPVRWQLSGAIFIDEPADYSLQYQQHNIGAELIGQSGAMPDAEIIAMATQGMDKIGKTDWQVVIGHVGLQLHLLSRFNLDRRTYRILLTQRDRLKTEGKQSVLDYLAEILSLDEDISTSSANGAETEQLLDVLLDSTRYGSTMGGRNRHDIASRLLKKHDRGTELEQISMALDFLKAWGALRGTTERIMPQVENFIAKDDVTGRKLLDEWQETLTYLQAYDVSADNIIIQPDLTRNWDYYTGIVFGIHADGHYVASGGRYDGLTQLLGSEQAFPAVGFAYYTHHLIRHDEPSSVDYLTLGGNDAIAVIQWANALRQAGIRVQLVTNNPAIAVSDNQANYQNQTYTQDELIQELTQ
ncbi:MAG: ATP phosphoribosyltransferase regulatory subunit, partial [Chloroflexota bacterium]